MTELVIEYSILDYLIHHGDVLKQECNSYINHLKLANHPDAHEANIANLRLSFFITELTERLNLSYLDISSVVTDKYLRDVLWTN